MNAPRMPTKLPSPVDGGEFDFVAVDAFGAAWCWTDRELVGVSVDGETDDTVSDECDVLR